MTVVNRMESHVGCTAVPNPADNGPSNILAWDGRLDNRADLLWQIGVLPSDTSDAAVVLAAYDRWGIPGMGKVIGDWSIVIQDFRTGDIILASDFAGVRPLYYYCQPGKVLWSSRLEQLVNAIGTVTIDEQYVAGFLLFGGCPTRTPYVGICSVPAGQAVRVTATGFTTHTFWSPPLADVVRYRDERMYDEHMTVLFREAVAGRLQTDGLVLAELSGGLDSSSVVCMAEHLVRSGAVAARGVCSVSYEHRGSLDTPFIRDVEAFCGIDGFHLSTHEHPLICEDGAGNANPDGWEPVYQAVAALARRLKASVLLTGHNGDLVNGNWLDDSLQVATSLRGFRLGRACDEALSWSRALGVPMVQVFWHALRAALPPTYAPAAVYATDGMPGTGVGGVEETSVVESFSERTGMAAPLSHFSQDWMSAPPERRKHFLALTMMRELRSLQRPEPLQELDYTHPFAHRPLVEFLMSVPADALCRPGEPRRMMRRALAELWPAKLRKRRSKSLFRAPWVEALRPLALKLLGTRRWHVVERGWIDRAGLTHRLRRLSFSLDCNEAQLRLILVLEYWLRNREHKQQAEAKRQIA